MKIPPITTLPLTKQMLVLMNRRQNNVLEVVGKW